MRNNFRNLVILVSIGISTALIDMEECFDLIPYAINPEYLEILNGGGDVSNNAAVYFEIPSTFVNGETVYCLQDIMIPDTVGGKSCNDSQKQCWLAVGHRSGRKETEVAASQYSCLCSGSTMNPFDSSDESISDGCGLQDNDHWGLTCRDSGDGRTTITDDAPPFVSMFASAFVSVCSGIATNCGVCEETDGIHPSFVVGVQWVSDLQEQCMRDPFASYDQYCTNPRYSTVSIVGLGVGSALLLLAIVSLLYFYLVVRKRRNKSLSIGPEKDVERQRHRASEAPPLEEISITTDGSPID